MPTAADPLDLAFMRAASSDDTPFSLLDAAPETRSIEPIEMSAAEA